METNVNYTVVGAFVLLLFASIVLAIIWLSAGFSFERYDIYKVYMEESVSGLSLDSPVEFNGVQVGKVIKIKIDKNPRLVALLLSVKHTTPVTKGTVAMLTTRGITGIIYISLIDKGTSREKLTIQPHEKYPVLPTQPSIFVRLDSALAQLTSSFTHVDKALSNLLSKDNVETLKEILSSIRTVAATFAKNSNNISDILVNTRQASYKFTPLLQSGQGMFQTLQSQTLPSVNQAFGDLENATRLISEFATQLKQNPSILIRGRSPGTPGPGETLR